MGDWRGDRGRTAFRVERRTIQPRSHGCRSALAKGRTNRRLESKILIYKRRDFAEDLRHPTPTWLRLPALILNEWGDVWSIRNEPSYMHPYELPQYLVWGPFVLAALVALAVYRSYLKLPAGRLLVLWLIGVILGALCILYRYPLVRQGRLMNHPEFQAVISVTAGSWFVLAAIPFAMNLYLKWVAGQLTPEEKSAGREGIRAWLKGGNLIGALCLAFFGWLGFDYSFWGILALALGALLAYPVFTIASQPATSLATTEQRPTAERETILRLLEDGRISAEESAELLNALQTESKPTVAIAALTPARKMILVGVVLLLFGFFLPWFRIDLGAEASRQMQNLPSNMPEMNGNFSGQQPFPPNLRTGAYYVTGGEIPHALGWLALFLGIIVAALPFLVPSLNRQTQRTIVYGALGIGAIILFYLLIQYLRYVSIGLILALAGYALEFMGSLSERRSGF